MAEHLLSIPRALGFIHSTMEDERKKKRKTKTCWDTALATAWSARATSQPWPITQGPSPNLSHILKPFVLRAGPEAVSECPQTPSVTKTHALGPPLASGLALGSFSPSLCLGPPEAWLCSQRGSVEHQPLTYLVRGKHFLPLPHPSRASSQDSWESRFDQHQSMKECFSNLPGYPMARHFRESLHGQLGDTPSTLHLPQPESCRKKGHAPPTAY